MGYVIPEPPLPATPAHPSLNTRLTSPAEVTPGMMLLAADGRPSEVYDVELLLAPARRRRPFWGSRRRSVYEIRHERGELLIAPSGYVTVVMESYEF